MTDPVPVPAQKLSVWNEVYKTVVVSTAHLPEKLAQQMENHDPLIKCVFTLTGYGFRLWLHSDFFPEELIQIRNAAVEEGAKWIEFDCDADVYDEFPQWEW